MKKENYIFGGLAALLLLFLGYETYTFNRGGHHMMMTGSHMTGGMHMTGGTHSPFTFHILNPTSILTLLLIAAFVYLIIKSTQEENGETPAVKILKERYAKGEITREEFLEIFKDIKEKEN